MTHLFQSAYNYGTGWAGYDSQVQPKNKMASSENQNTLGGNFSIDDAFESDEEDPIRVYGATTDRTPFREKRRPDDVKVEVEEHNEQVSNFCFESESSWSKFICLHS